MLYYYSQKKAEGNTNLLGVSQLEILCVVDGKHELSLKLQQGQHCHRKHGRGKHTVNRVEIVNF